MNCIWLGSALLGLTEHMNCLYVTLFMWSTGTSYWKMNSIVLVGFFMRPPMPFANHPNSLAADRVHPFCVLGCSLAACSLGACLCPCPLLPLLNWLCYPVVWYGVWVKQVHVDAIAVSWLLQQSLVNVLVVAHPTVAYVNVCSKKGVQLGLLLLPLALWFLCAWLSWLE
jgi:hypothetical protein